MKHKIGYCLMHKWARQDMRYGSCFTANSYQLFSTLEEVEAAYKPGFDILEVYVDLPSM